MYKLLPILLFAYSVAQFSEYDVERTGDILMVLIPTIAFSNTYFLEENNEGSKQFMKALVSTEIITEALKIITHKRRPNGSDYKSFPSGHNQGSRRQPSRREGLSLPRRHVYTAVPAGHCRKASSRSGGLPIQHPHNTYASHLRDDRIGHGSP